MREKLIEEQAVSNLKTVLRKISVKDSSLEYDILENDKTPLTDGFIRVNNKEIQVQVKGSKKITCSKNIERKYINYANDNLLLYILVDNASCEETDSGSRIFYEFFTIKFLEKLCKGKGKQKSIKYNFEKQLTVKTWNDFKQELELFHLENPYAKKKNITNLFNKNKDGTIVKGTVKIDPTKKFYNYLDVSITSLKDNDTELTYSPENIVISRIYPQKKKDKLLINNKEYQLKAETDLVGNIKVITGNIEWFLKEIPKKITLTYTQPKYLNDIDTMSFDILNECMPFSSYEEYKKTNNKRVSSEEEKVIKKDIDFMNNLKNEIKSKLEIKNMVFEKIPLDIQMPIEKSQLVLDLINNKNKLKTPLHLIDLEDSKKIAFIKQDEGYRFINKEDFILIGLNEIYNQAFEVPALSTFYLADIRQNKNIDIHLKRKQEIINYNQDEALLEVLKILKVHQKNFKESIIDIYIFNQLFL